jgi:hypothetical protein
MMAPSQTVSIETMACVLALIGDNLGYKAYELMATLDGNRSSHAFRHLAS